MAEQNGLVVLAEFEVEAGRMEQFLALVERHARNSLGQEPGCLQFDIVRDSRDGSKVFLYEVYADDAAFELHKAAPYLQAFREQAKGLIASSTVTSHRRVAAPQKPKAKRDKVFVAITHLLGRQHLLEPLAKAGFEIVLNPFGRPMSEAEIIEHLPGAVASIAGSEPYTGRVLSAASGLKVVARLGVGYDAIDVAAATRHGVAIAMAFGTNHEPVADHAFALMAASAHALGRYDRAMREGRWQLLFHGRITGATVGIVGFGRIGRALAKRCQGFGMQVLVSDPFMDVDMVKRLGCRLTTLDEVLSKSDFVSLHAPLSHETTHMIDGRRLALMKPGAFLINTARGGLVDEAALVAALEQGRIAGAGLDVFEREPLAKDSPLLGMQNVILTPHSAGASEWAIESMAARAIDNVLQICRGEDPGGGLVLNPEVLTSSVGR